MSSLRRRAFLSPSPICGSRCGASKEPEQAKRVKPWPCGFLFLRPTCRERTKSFPRSTRGDVCRYFLTATYFEVESLTHAGGMEIILSELWPQYFRRRLCGADSNVFSGSKLFDLKRVRNEVQCDRSRQGFPCRQALPQPTTLSIIPLLSEATPPFNNSRSLKRSVHLTRTLRALGALL